MPIDTKLGRVGTYYEGFLPKKSQDALIIISLSAYGQQTCQSGDLPWGLPPIKPNDRLIAWSYEITWQIKTIIYSQTPFLLPLNLGSGDLSRVAPFHSLMVLESCGLARSCEKVKTLYLHYHNAYCHQIWQGGDLRLEGLHPMTSHGFWGMRSCMIIWQINSIIFLRPQCLWLSNLTGWWLTMRDSHLKYHMSL